MKLHKRLFRSVPNSMYTSKSQKAVEGNKKLYLHTFTESQELVEITVICDNDKPFTNKTFNEWLYKNGYTSQVKSYNVGTCLKNLSSVATDSSLSTFIGVYSNGVSEVKTNFIINLTETSYDNNNSELKVESKTINAGTIDTEIFYTLIEL